MCNVSLLIYTTQLKSLKIKHLTQKALLF